jgi:hypothetical protein
MKKDTLADVFALPFIIKTLYNNTPLKEAEFEWAASRRRGELAFCELESI